MARVGKRRTQYGVLVGKVEGKRPLGGHRRRREDNIKLGPKEREWEDVGWTDQAQDREKCRAVVAAVMNVRVV